MNVMWNRREVLAMPAAAQASRAQHPGCDPDRLHEGLRDDRRRERRHRDHGPRALRRRDLVRARLRPDAPDRYRDLDAHGGARDQGLPLAARGLEVYDYSNYSNKYKERTFERVILS